MSYAAYVRRCIVLTFAALVMLVTLNAAQADDISQVVLKDGQTFEGVIVSQTDTVIQLKIGDIITPIQMADVQSVNNLGSVEQQYKTRRAKLDDKDLSGRYDLAYWLFQQKAYQLAADELMDLKRRFPDDNRTSLLLKVVQERLKLNEEAPGVNKPAGSNKGETEQAETSADGTVINGVKLLTPEEVNTIRVWELPEDFDKTRPPLRISVPREVMEDAMRKYASSPLVPKGTAKQNEMLRKPGYEQLAFLFALRAREYYPQVMVRQDPPTMQTFRQQVNPQYVSTYFARYFGNGQIPGLRLVDQRPNGEAEAYTNFFILQNFQYNNRAMIDRLDPEKSLLLQWGLPRNVADFPAPEGIEGWQPRFNNTDDPNYKIYRKWIDDLTNAPEYDIPARSVRPASADKPAAGG